MSKLLHKPKLKMDHDNIFWSQILRKKKKAAHIGLSNDKSRGVIIKISYLTLYAMHLKYNWNTICKTNRI